MRDDPPAARPPAARPPAARPPAARSPAARSPEELDRLLEDAFVLRDAAALSRLFEACGVLVAAGSAPARGRADVGRLGTRLWQEGRGYVADPRRVETAGGVALVLGDGAAHVARRARDGSWRLVIAVYGT